MATGELAAMGGGHDLMDPVSHHGAERDNAGRGGEPSGSVFDHGGQRFPAYGCEWWHYTLKDEPYPETYFDFPIT